MLPRSCAPRTERPMSDLVLRRRSDLATYVKHCPAAATPTDQRDAIPLEHRRGRFLPWVLRFPRHLQHLAINEAGRGTNLIAADDNAGFVAVEEEDGRRHGCVAE